MQVGKLYFVKDEFYERFKGYGLLENSDILDGKEHGRPCCYLFKYTQKENDIYFYGAEGNISALFIFKKKVR